MVCTCSAFRTCPSPEGRIGQVTSSQTPLTPDTTCLHFSPQTDATDLCAREHLVIRTASPPPSHLQPKQLTQGSLPCSVIHSPSLITDSLSSTM